MSWLWGVEGERDLTVTPKLCFVQVNGLMVASLVEI